MAADPDILESCENRIGYRFRDRALLRRCLTHSSSAETRLDSNERLEFLGDAVLGLIICEHLFQLFPDQREGQLTQMKSWLVSRQTCARVARALNLEPLIFVGRGLQQIPESIMSAVVESLIAGVYFDGGLESARSFILSAFGEELRLCRPLDAENHKSQLQEYTQRELSCTPEYFVQEEFGPDHAREFLVAARVGERTFPSGRGRSKKEAEQQAARNALLGLLSPELDGLPEGSGHSELPEVCGDIRLRLTPAGGGDTTFDTLENGEKSMFTTEASVILRPDGAEQRFLPEGPYWLGADRASWVAIQHGAEATTGSLNILHLDSGRNESWSLPGRPGFAFPTSRDGVFVIGAERQVALFDTATGTWDVLISIEQTEDRGPGTVINDAVIWEDCLIFGCKYYPTCDQPIGGLYLWRQSDQRLVQLLGDQKCSNGKAVLPDAAGELWLYDIDSPTKQIVRYPLDIAAGRLDESRREVVVDLTAENVYPDGMILTPDHRSLIVALYDPGDPAAGAARQYSLSSGALEAVWRCPGSPRVTCPQLVQHEGRVRLLLTTAVEQMDVAQQERHPHAGCLFIGDTPFTALGDQPVFPILRGSRPVAR
jgi:ribonuclease III